MGRFGLQRCVRRLFLQRRSLHGVRNENSRLQHGVRNENSRLQHGVHNENSRRQHARKVRSALRKESIIPDQLHRDHKQVRRQLRSELEPPDQHTAQACNRIYHCRKDFQQAITILRDFERFHGANMFVYTAAISCCAKAMKPLYVDDLFREMVQRGLKPNIVTYGAVMSVNAKFGYWNKTLDILREMRQQEIQPNVIVYNSAINACTKGKEPQEAVKLWKEMIADGIEPDDYSYGALVNLLISLRKYEEALRAFEQAKLKLDSVSVILYNAALNACVKLRDFDRMISVWDEMRKRLEPTRISYNTMLEGCAKTGNIEKAEEFLWEMKTKDMDPDVMTYSKLLNVEQDWRTLLRWFHKMRSENIVPDEPVYFTILGALLRDGEFDLADSVYLQGLEEGRNYLGTHQEGHKIDLHGCSEPVSICIVRRHIFEWRKEYMQKKTLPSNDISVVTGRGIHSEGGRSRLIPAMTKYFGENLPELEFTRDPSNPGQMVIGYSSLREYIRTRPLSDTELRHDKSGYWLSRLRLERNIF